MTKGVINLIARPAQRKSWPRSTAQVMRNNRVDGAQAQASRATCKAIKHVIYVVKENRTYDQVLGDARQGSRRRVADAVPPGLRAEPPRARAPLHAVRQLLRRRRRVRRRPELGGRRRRDRLHEQDLADHLLARARARPSARATSRTSRSRSCCSPSRSRSTPRSSAPRRRRRAATCGTTRTSSGVSFRDYGLYTTIPGDCKGAGEHVDDDAARRLALRRSRRRVLRRLQPDLLRPRGPPAGVGARVPRLRGALRAGPQARPAAAAHADAAARTTTRTARRRASAIPQAYMADNDLALGPARRRRLAQPRSGRTRRSS